MAQPSPGSVSVASPIRTPGNDYGKLNYKRRKRNDEDHEINAAPSNGCSRNDRGRASLKRISASRTLRSNVKLSRARVVDIQAILASVEKASKAEAERTTDDA